MPHFKLAAVVATTVTILLAWAGIADAYPMVRYSPKVLMKRAQPPTTAECEAEYEVACYSPSQIETAYNMRALYAQGDEGQGQTIVIVDSFGSPTIETDLKKFDNAFHLPAPPSFKIIQPAGAVKPFEPSNVEMSGWALETSLDVEYAHSMAPQANILLVETPEEETEGVQGFPQIVEAENYVINHKLGDVISQSFSATEESFPSTASLLSLRSAYENAAAKGVTVLDAAGDTGVGNTNLAGEVYRHRTVNWPASDPLVTGVGGTQLHLNEEGQPTAPATAWDELLGLSTVSSGGGESHVFALPEYQRLVNTHSGEHRAVPDISMSAAVNGGVLVYTSYPTTVPGEPAPKSFSIIGGTSEATPLFSGVVAIADQIAGHPLGLINPHMYQLESEGGDTGIVNVTSGNNSFVELNEEGTPLLTINGYEAKPGYDMVTGLGTVDAFPFAHALASPYVPTVTSDEASTTEPAETPESQPTTTGASPSATPSGNVASTTTGTSSTGRSAVQAYKGAARPKSSKLHLRSVRLQKRRNHDELRIAAEISSSKKHEEIRVLLLSSSGKVLRTIKAEVATNRTIRLAERCSSKVAKVKVTIAR